MGSEMCIRDRCDGSIRMNSAKDEERFLLYHWYTTPEGNVRRVGYKHEDQTVLTFTTKVERYIRSCAVVYTLVRTCVPCGAALFSVATSLYSAVRSISLTVFVLHPCSSLK